ncbi:hypothetical protein RND71_028490 [Anisodus tanguticus]|uniref:Uncharacterized protein n=1 Tax=Anisodus tanguticus TaxID=243964 RepID=A0AAE1V2N4_9SOLA|nr:hypothetical protein RND71_028490 [Anisodus tanguticus]
MSSTSIVILYTNAIGWGVKSGNGPATIYEKNVIGFVLHYRASTPDNFEFCCDGVQNKHTVTATTMLISKFSIKLHLQFLHLSKCDRRTLHSLFTISSWAQASELPIRYIYGVEPTHAEVYLLTHTKRKDGRSLDEESSNTVVRFLIQAGKSYHRHSDSSSLPHNQR